MAISFTMYPDEIVALQGIADSYGLMFRMPSDSIVYLTGDTYVVRFSVDADGASIWYYDVVEESRVDGYALGFLLFQKRHPVQVSDTGYANNVDRVRYLLQWVISVTVNYGSDVLRGSRDWFPEYTWDIQDVKGGLRDSILSAVSLRKGRSCPRKSQQSFDGRQYLGDSIRR